MKESGKKIMVFYITIMVIVVLFLGIGNNANAKEQLPQIQDLSSRGYIYIYDNNYSESGNGVSDGNGTESNPYIIENWEINGTSEGYCVIIEECDAYAIIKNCYIYGGRGEDAENSGILFYDCSNITIENCTVNDNDIGMYIYNCTNVLINDNNLDSNGIEPSGGGGEIEFTGIDVLSSNNITVSNNYITNENTVSIRLYQSIYCIVDSNYILNGTEDGIDISRSRYNIIRNNYVTECLRGLYGIGQQYDKHCEYNTIYNNSFINNEEVGIYFYNTENNTLYFNNLIGNEGTVLEYNSPIYNGEYYSNRWYASGYDSKLVGNYYDDYTGEDTTGDGIGETPYAIVDITPQTVNYDYYPLTTPFNGTLPTQDMSWGETLIETIMVLLPFIIVILIIKKIYEWINKSFKDSGR